MQAVFTCDIVNSTGLSKATEKKLLKKLFDLFDGYKIEFYRGDSFQVYVKQPKEALRLALLSRAAAIGCSNDELSQHYDIRISIGMGRVQSPVRSLKTAKGEAFVLSGRHLDELIKTGARLAITTTNELANAALQVIADYADVIFGSMSGKQAEVIFELMKGQTQQLVAKKLKKTKSSIHQRVTAGRWPEVAKLLLHYDNIIKHIA